MASAAKTLIRKIVTQSSEIRRAATQHCGYGFSTSLSNKFIGYDAFFFVSFLLGAKEMKSMKSLAFGLGIRANKSLKTTMYFYRRLLVADYLLLQFLFGALNYLGML